MTTTCQEPSRNNSEILFWARVRFDRERGYAPAGQVNPPPQPKSEQPAAAKAANGSAYASH
jgi:hypothetical protein